MIKLQVIGNLGKDCMVNLVNGKNVINFNIAHTERFRDSSGQPKEKTTWVECAYWTDRTGVSPYLKKGTQVYVEGIPEVRQFTRNDGTPGSSLSLRVTSLQLLGARDAHMGGEGAQPTQSPASVPQTVMVNAQAPQMQSPDGGDSDLPF